MADTISSSRCAAERRCSSARTPRTSSRKPARCAAPCRPQPLSSGRASWPRASRRGWATRPCGKRSWRGSAPPCPMRDAIGERYGAAVEPWLQACRAASERPAVFLIAGDVSGDRQGAALARAIRASGPEVRLLRGWRRRAARRRRRGVRRHHPDLGDRRGRGGAPIRRALRARYRAVRRAVARRAPAARGAGRHRSAAAADRPVAAARARAAGAVFPAAGVDVGALAPALGAVDGPTRGLGVRVPRRRSIATPASTPLWAAIRLRDLVQVERDPAAAATRASGSIPSGRSWR